MLRKSTLQNMAIHKLTLKHLKYCSISSADVNTPIPAGQGGLLGRNVILTAEHEENPNRGEARNAR